MSRILNTTAATIVLSLGLAAPALATNYQNYHPWAAGQANTYVRYAGPVSLHGYYAHHPYAGQLPDYASQHSATPQFNDPGGQISVPRPGKAVEQLSRFSTPDSRTRWGSNKGAECRSDEQVELSVASLEALAPMEVTESRRCAGPTIGYR